MTVTIIEASKKPEVRTSKKQIQRVAAYCRVSTDSDEQESSYEAQCRHYTALIAANSQWENAGIFADEGISGTSVKNRQEFNRMIKECEAGNVDMVITKSISRFSRNTLDCLNYIRKLRSLNIPVLFEKEGINTMDSSGEVLLTILASIAQQESKSISDNVRIGINYRMQEGKGRLNTSRFLGLTKENGKLVIIPHEAETIRLIYRLYLEGSSPARIAAYLSENQFTNATGTTTWYASSVANILSNEKYCGDLLLQKYYTEDFLTHKIVRNTGELPMYYVENNHEPIVPKEIFYQVQLEKQRRSSLKQDPSRFRVRTKPALNGRLICGKCGRALKRYSKPDEDLTDWRCRKRAMVKKSNTKEQPGSACDCRIVLETEVKKTVVSAFNRLSAYQKELICKKEETEAAIKQLFPEKENEMCSEKAELYNQAVQIRSLLELIEQMNEQEEAEVSFPSSCSDYEEFFLRTARHLSNDVLQDGQIVSFEEDMIIRYVESITVFEKGYSVRFKAGIEVMII